jgi:hypothetical protein
MPCSLKLSLPKFLRILAIFTFSFAAFATVNADPITVTGTAVSVNGAFFGPSIGFNLTGQNFSASVGDSGGADHIGNFGIFPCSRTGGGLLGPCTSANLGYHSQSDLRGTFTFNGQTFNASVIDSLNFQLTSPTFVIPPEFLDDEAIVITAPFSFLGSALIAQSGELIQLQGQGTVRLLLTRQTVGSITGLFLDHADYTFGSTVAGVTIEPVPEPATMVLLFTGLAGAAVRFRKRLRP